MDTLTSILPYLVLAVFADAILIWAAVSVFSFWLAKRALLRRSMLLQEELARFEARVPGGVRG